MKSLNLPAGICLALSLVVTGCKEDNSIPDPETTSVILNANEVYTKALTSRRVTLAIRPKATDTPPKASSTRFQINGNYFPAYIANVNYKFANKGDTYRNIDVCNDMKPGKDIQVKYEYLAADSSTVESGQVTLAEVVYTCK